MKKSLLSICRLSLLLIIIACAHVHASARENTTNYSDTLRVLCVGNSFTYVDSAHIKLQQIAASQGHYLAINAQLQGGYTFQRHLRRDETLSAIIYFQYDRVFLQDQSQTPALYGKNPKRCHYIAEDGAELADRIRMYSPSATVYMEQTWSYEAGNYGGFGSHDNFDALLKKGSQQMAKKMHATVSPIGEAFRLCRAEHPEINLYSSDLKHQSAYGSYLKACVNYLLLYATPFTEKAAVCGLDPQTCRNLQKIAEAIVL